MTEQTAQVVEAAVRSVRKEWDWATVREAAKLAAETVVSFAESWMCSRGLHVWQTWEYEDGTIVDECDSCQVQAAH